MPDRSARYPVPFSCKTLLRIVPVAVLFRHENLISFIYAVSGARPFTCLLLTSAELLRQNIQPIHLAVQLSHVIIAKLSVHEKSLNQREPDLRTMVKVGFAISGYAAASTSASSSATAREGTKGSTLFGSSMVLVLETTYHISSSNIWLASARAFS